MLELLHTCYWIHFDSHLILIFIPRFWFICPICSSIDKVWLGAVENSVPHGVWHYSFLFHNAGWGHHTTLSTDIFIHEIELLYELSSKCFVSWFSGLNFRPVVFQLCIARPLPTHLTFLKKRLSSVIDQPTSDLEWKGTVAAKANNQMECSIMCFFFL